MRLAVRLGIDKRRLVRIAPPGSEDLFGKVHQAAVVSAAQAQDGQGPRERHTFTAENVEGILRDEVGKVFAQVLEHAGVFKCDEQGRSDGRAERRGP